MIDGREKTLTFCFRLADGEPAAVRGQWDPVNRLGCLLAFSGARVELRKEEDGGNSLVISYRRSDLERERTRNAGRHRKNADGERMTVAEAWSLKDRIGAKKAAERLGMSLSTFYRHLSDTFYGEPGDLF
jgi:hypothetical protein